MLLLFSVSLLNNICTGKSCSFGFRCMRVYQCVNSHFPIGFGGGMWDLIVLVPDHCLSFYFNFLP